MNRLGLDQSKLLTPSWNLVPRSYRLALKGYEQIVVLFFIPLLFSILGSIYLGPINFAEFTKHGLDTRQSVGAGLMAVWLFLSIVNFAPSVYFRLESVKARTMPSLRECYTEGFARIWRILAVELISYLIIIIGLIAFLIPGVLFFRRYALSVYYALDNPKLKLHEILSKSSNETKPFMYSVYGTYGVVIIVSLVLQLMLGSFVLGDIVAALFGYSVLFLPALRYQEISGFKADVKTHKKSARAKKA